MWCSWNESKRGQKEEDLTLGSSHFGEASCDGEVVGDDVDGDGGGGGGDDCAGDDFDCDGDDDCDGDGGKGKPGSGSLWVAPGCNLINKISAQNVAKSQNCCLKSCHNISAKKTISQIFHPILSFLTLVGHCWKLNSGQTLSPINPLKTGYVAALSIDTNPLK